MISLIIAYFFAGAEKWFDNLLGFCREACNFVTGTELDYYTQE